MPDLHRQHTCSPSATFPPFSSLATQGTSAALPPKSFLYKQRERTRHNGLGYQERSAFPPQAWQWRRGGCPQTPRQDSIPHGECGLPFPLPPASESPGSNSSLACDVAPTGRAGECESLGCSKRMRPLMAQSHLLGFTIASSDRSGDGAVCLHPPPAVFTCCLLLWCAGECGCEEGPHQYLFVPSFFDSMALALQASSVAQFLYFICALSPIVAFDPVSSQFLPAQHIFPASILGLICYHVTRIH